MNTALAVAASAGICVGLLVPDSGPRLRRVLPGGRQSPTPAPAALFRAVLSVSYRPRFAALLAAAVATALAGPVAGVAAAVAAAMLARSLATSRKGAEAARTWAAASRSIAGLAGELRAGRSPTEALQAVAASAPTSVSGPLLAAAGAARLGADPAAALVQHAGHVPAMEQLAACWRVAARTGAGLAEVADALAEDLRVTQRRRGDLAVEVSASRASAKLLAGLPLVGIALGASLGARPLHFLLHTSLGAAVLAVGLVFEVVGLLWTDRLIRSVERTP